MVLKTRSLASYGAMPFLRDSLPMLDEKASSSLISRKPALVQTFTVSDETTI